MDTFCGFVENVVTLIF